MVAIIGVADRHVCCVSVYNMLKVDASDRVARRRWFYI